jgi:hypothetical protein
MTTTVYRAALDTRNFEFEAYGETDEAARHALAEGLERHVAQYRLDGPAFREEVADDIVVRLVELGRAYRDREPI